jgi:hypothetical protein
VADSRRGETAGWGLRGFTTWYEGVAEKATRRESPLISVPQSRRSYTAYKLLVINTLRADLDANPRRSAPFVRFNVHRAGPVKGTMVGIRALFSLWLRQPVVIVAAASPRLDAQGPSSIEAFEVASIKPRTGERAGPAPSSPDRFIRPDATLGELIRYAYDPPGIPDRGRTRLAHVEPIRRQRIGRGDPDLDRCVRLCAGCSRTASG